MKPVRQSSFELLRLICMAMVLVVHLLVAIGGVGTKPFNTLLESLSIVAVNVFVLISGYFGLKFSLKSFLGLWGVVLFYSLLGYGYAFFIQHTAFTPEWLFSLVPYNSPYWFVNSYLVLLLLSPALNAFIKQASQAQLQKTLWVLAFLSCVLGFLFKSPINDNGYNATQMVFVYFIGHYLALYGLPIKLNRLSLLAVYLGCSIVLTLLLLLTPFNPWWLLAYNNPITVVSSVAFFLIFSQIPLTSRFINSCASSSLAIYLLHKHPAFFSMYKEFFASLTSFWLIILWVGLIFFSSIVIDKARLGVFIMLKAPFSSLTK